MCRTYAFCPTNEHDTQLKQDDDRQGQDDVKHEIWRRNNTC